MKDGKIIAQARAAFSGKILESHSQCGDETIVIPRDEAGNIFRHLQTHEDFAFDFLIDVTAVDYLDREPRFDVVYHLYSLRHNHRVRVKIRVAEDDAWVLSLVSLWKTADWLEREVWDMFGIRFVGHPSLRRILMYEEFVGHPLRKDYPVARRQPLVEERDPVENPWPRGKAENR